MGCPPLGVAKEKWLDCLDRGRDSAVKVDKAQITEVVSHAQIFEQEMMEILEVGLLNSASVHVHHELNFEIVD